MRITEETRREAYISVQPKIPPMARKVLAAVGKLGNATAEEVMAEIKTHNPNNVAPRLTGLRDGGYIEANGKRPNRGGHNMAVWQVTDKGKAALRGENTEDGGRGKDSKERIPPESGDVNV